MRPDDLIKARRISGRVRCNLPVPHRRISRFPGQAQKTMPSLATAMTSHAHKNVMPAPARHHPSRKTLDRVQAESMARCHGLHAERFFDASSGLWPEPTESTDGSMNMSTPSGAGSSLGRCGASWLIARDVPSSGSA